MIVFETNHGNIAIKLDSQGTPNTADNFLNYVKDGYYDGTIFHRVIEGFMIQGGGFTPGMEEKDSGESIENEADKGTSNKRGTIAMARTSDPHSASAQFFINVKDNAFLDHKNKTPDGWGYCAFGEVVEGMDVVDKIKGVNTTTRSGHQDVPEEDVVVTKVYIKED